MHSRGHGTLHIRSEGTNRLLLLLVVSRDVVELEHVVVLGSGDNTREHFRVRT